MQELFRTIFDEEMFSDLYYVNDNPAVVSTINISKQDGCVVSEKVVRTFNLSSADEQYPAYIIKHLFFVRLNFQWHAQHVRYFPGNFISRILFGTNPKIIKRLVSEYDWAIVSPDLLSEIENIPGCEVARPAKEIDVLVGIRPALKVGKTTFYVVPDDIVETHGHSSTIYVGNKCSITPVVHITKNFFSFEINKNNDIKKYVLK